MHVYACSAFDEGASYTCIAIFFCSEYLSAVRAKVGELVSIYSVQYLSQLCFISVQYADRYELLYPFFIFFLLFLLPCSSRPPTG